MRRALIAALVLAGATFTAVGAAPASARCAPVGYDASRDADPAYWQQWDALMAAGYHGHPGDGREALYPPGC